MLERESTSRQKKREEKVLSNGVCITVISSLFFYELSGISDVEKKCTLGIDYHTERSNHILLAESNNNLLLHKSFIKLNIFLQMKYLEIKFLLSILKLVKIFCEFFIRHWFSFDFGKAYGFHFFCLKIYHIRVYFSSELSCSIQLRSL